MFGMRGPGESSLSFTASQLRFLARIPVFDDLALMDNDRHEVQRGLDLRKRGVHKFETVGQLVLWGVQTDFRCNTRTFDGRFRIKQLFDMY